MNTPLTEDGLKILKVELIYLHKGKPRGNLECGSAQPSLFSISLQNNFFAFLIFITF
jgi:hypothetical protein